MKRIMLILVFLFLIMTSVSNVDAALVSTFDDSKEGWSFIEHVTLSWESTGGNPDGYLQGRDIQDGATYYFVSPSSWGGDWNQYVGQEISFDLKLINTGGSDPMPNRKIIFIEGNNGNSLFWNGDHPGSDWTHYILELNYLTFGVTERLF